MGRPASGLAGRQAGGQLRRRQGRRTVEEPPGTVVERAENCSDGSRKAPLCGARLESGLVNARLADDAARPARVLLLGRPGCHLCDDAREVVARVTAEVGERFVERDITEDPALLAEHGESIPVVFVDGVQVDFWRVSPQRLRAALTRR